MTDGERAAAALIARLRGEMASDRTLLRRCMANAQDARERLMHTPNDSAALALAAVALDTVDPAVAAALDGFDAFLVDL